MFKIAFNIYHPHSIRSKCFTWYYINDSNSIVHIFGKWCLYKHSKWINNSSCVRNANGWVASQYTRVCNAAEINDRRDLHNHLTVTVTYRVIVQNLCMNILPTRFFSGSAKHLLVLMLVFFFLNLHKHSFLNPLAAGSALLLSKSAWKE